MSWTFVIGLTLQAVIGFATPPVAPDHGGFVTTLGRDTMAVERFTWTATRLTGDVVLTSPSVVRAHYSVILGPNGAPAEFTLEQRAVNDTSPPLSLKITVGTDSIRFTRTRGATSKYEAAPTESAVYPENLYFWALYELQSRAFMKAPSDSVPFRMFSAGGPKPYTVVFKRRAQDTLSTKFFYPEYWMNYHVNAQGQLLAVDGSHTTIKVLAMRQAEVPLEAFQASAAARERTAGAVGAMSKSDSITTVVGDVNVSVAYSRPAVRGRQIWGGIVPWGTVWRTGANSATRLHLAGAVEIGGKRIPAGDYTIFSLPTGKGADLIINRQSGQWGTEYHEDRDVARIPVRAVRTPEHVELFTIRFAAADAETQELIIEWDDVRWSVPVRKAPSS